MLSLLHQYAEEKHLGTDFKVLQGVVLVHFGPGSHVPRRVVQDEVFVRKYVLILRCCFTSEAGEKMV